MEIINQYYWVYILHCDNDTYYTGYTIDLKKRYRSHVYGTGKCKYTNSFKPLYIAQCWKINADKSFAMLIERGIKKLSRAEKEIIIVHPETISTDERVQAVARESIVEIHAAVLTSKQVSNLT